MVKIFICHYTPLVERRTFLQSQLDQCGLTNVEWVTEKDLAGLDLSTYYDGSDETLKKRNETTFKAFNYGDQPQLTTACTELTTQHVLAYKRIIDQDLESGIVFEDDTILAKDFNTKIEQYMQELPDDWDIFYFGSGHSSSLRSKMTLTERIRCWRGNQHVFRRENRQSRWTDSYAVSRKAAETLMPTIIPFSYPIDWELNYQQAIHEMNVYWGEPTISKQGSGQGFYESSLRE
jgi:GR25 family glycosyltransferase involved in LPS biosynthesis